MAEAYIIDVARTPFAPAGGALAGVRADVLASLPIRALLSRLDMDGDLIEDVVMGCATPAGEQGGNLARAAGLLAGLHVDTTGVTVNRSWASGQQAVNIAAMAVSSGFHDLVIAGGVDSVSRVPPGADRVIGAERAGTAPDLDWRFSPTTPGESAELVAERFGLSRGEIDAYALQSHLRAAKARQRGDFAADLVPVETEAGVVGDDTAHRSGELSQEALGALPPLRSGGVVSAAAAAPWCDGAAAILLASGQMVQRYGLKPRARIVSVATAGVDPTLMMTAPSAACAKALAVMEMNARDMDAVEMDEVFAPVTLGCGRQIDAEFADMNVFGGSLALGHALAASGVRQVMNLIRVLASRDGRFGLSLTTSGDGQGVATVLDAEFYM